jgi:hypothetical protein
VGWAHLPGTLDGGPDAWQVPVLAQLSEEGDESFTLGLGDHDDTSARSAIIRRGRGAVTFLDE